MLPNVVSLSAAICACEKGQELPQASGLLALMQLTCILPGIMSYSAVISDCEKGQRWQQALGLLALIQRTATLHAAISACEKGEQWQQARCLLAVMQETDLVPNVITYSAAIGAARKVHNGRRHLAFWR